MSMQVQRDYGMVLHQGCWQGFRQCWIDCFVKDCLVFFNIMENDSQRERSWSEKAGVECCRVYTVFCECLCCGCFYKQTADQQSVATTNSDMTGGRESISTVCRSTHSRSAATNRSSDSTALDGIVEDMNTSNQLQATRV